MRRFARLADNGGSDVRLDIGALYRPRAWPRAPINPMLWRWCTSFSRPAVRGAHINYNELLALTLAVRSRCRRASACRSVFFHLLDSQVVLAVGKCVKRQMLVRCRSNGLVGDHVLVCLWVYVRVLGAPFPLDRGGMDPSDGYEWSE